VMGPCLGGFRGSTRLPSLRMAVNGGREWRRCSVSDLAGGELELEPGNDRGNEDVWKVARSGVSSMMCSEVRYIGRRDREWGWPDRGCGMAVTRSSAISSGRSGRGGMGEFCGLCGDVGDAVAQQDDAR
jgi:hypothetical protein